jgi:hypothetical protein
VNATAAAVPLRIVGDIIRYHPREAPIADILIRDLPPEAVAAIDAEASRLGISRNEYLRRRLTADAAAIGGPVTVEDLSKFAGRFADLGDPDVMSGAWQ